MSYYHLKKKSVKLTATYTKKFKYSAMLHKEHDDQVPGHCSHSISPVIEVITAILYAEKWNNREVSYLPRVTWLSGRAGI